MSALLKLLNVIIIIQKVISNTYTQQYTTPGSYAVMIPSNSSRVSMSMWGAGGAGTGTMSFWGASGAGTGITFGSASNAIMYPGGSGAFISCSIIVPPGSTIYLLVGGGGAVANYGQGTSSAIGGGGQ